MKGCKTTPDRVAFCATRLPEAFPKLAQYCKSRTEKNTNRLAHLSCFDRLYVRTQDLRTAKTGDLGGVHGTNDALVPWRYAKPKRKICGNRTKTHRRATCLSESLRKLHPSLGRTDLRRALVEVPRCRRKNEAKRDAGVRTPETLGLIREPPGHRMRGSERARRMHSRC